MRIAFCCLEWEPVAGGGIRTYVENATRFLAELGHESHVLTYAHKGAGPDRERKGVQVHRVRLTWLQRQIYRASVLLGLGDFTFRTFYSLQIARKVRDLARAGAIDVVESPDYAAEGLALTWLQRRSRSWRLVPHVVMLHTPTFVLNAINGRRCRPLGWVHEKIENWNIRHAPHLSSPSRALARRVAAGLHTGQPIHHDPYPFGIDGITTAATPATASTTASGTTTLLYVGRLEFRKGVTFLVEALRALCPRHPELRAELIGGDTPSAPGGGSMRRHLEARIAGDLRDHVQIVDRLPREQLFDRYRAASFCVFPSVFENFANTCLEAITLGRVVVVPRDSGMAELVEDGVSGFWFENGNVADLVRAIETCLSQRARWEQMAHAAQAALARDFEPTRLLQRKLAHYATLRA
jgi:glycosyltransferase involved in cell wall biosynthesis